jgi:hypothetical protein
MNLVDIRRFEMLTRVRDFGLEHAAVFPAASPGGKIFGELNAAVARLDEEAVSQYTGVGSSIGGTASKASARAALRDTLHTFVLTAQAIAVAKGTSGLEDQFRMPPHGDQRLLTAAKAFAEEATPIKADFIAHAMPPTFIDDLNAQVAEFEGIQQSHTLSKETRAAARYGMDAAMEQGIMAAIRLDAVVTNTLKHDGASMAKWSVARHVEYPGKSHAHHPKPVVPAQPVAPAPAQ